MLRIHFCCLYGEALSVVVLLIYFFDKDFEYHVSILDKG